MQRRQHNVIYLPHGGGPLPLLADPNHKAMVELLNFIASQLPKPQAIIVISAHWEEQNFSLTASATPKLIYDYYGFPPQAYEIQYPAAGNPRLAEKIDGILREHGLAPQLDKHRGFDHGLFVPLKIMYPAADIPCIQISLKNNLDPYEHIRLGQALQNLAADNLLFIGSGLSFHNLENIFSQHTAISQRHNQSFEDWLSKLIKDKNITEENRIRTLVNWKNSPGADFCHPREEHLLPLHVCYGIAGKACDKDFHIKIYDKEVSCYLWEIGGY